MMVEKPKIQEEKQLIPILQRAQFENVTQKEGGARKQMVMLVTWGAHTLEKQFGEDVVDRIEKIKGDRDIRFHEFESPFIHSKDLKEKYEMDTGKDWRIWKESAEVKKERFNNLRTFNEMFKAAGKEGAGLLVDIHYGGVTHVEETVHDNPKIKEVKSSPMVFVIANSKEVFEKYLKIPDIVADLDEQSLVSGMRIRDRMKILIQRPDYGNKKAVLEGMRDFNMVQVEGMVFHNHHKTYEEMEKCSIGKEEYEQVVDAAADAVIRIYDYFNSKPLKKENTGK